MKLTRPKYIVFNGPPNSGKTTLAEEALRHLTRKSIFAVPESFAGPMKKFLASLLGVHYNYINKDANINNLAPFCTGRKFLIDLSEEYMKPRYGQTVFGRMLVTRTKDSRVYVIDDSGFEKEFSVLPLKDTHVIRVFRPGFDFSNDSRDYLERFDYLLVNDGDLPKALSVTRDITDAIIEKWKRDGDLTLTQSRDNQDVQASDNLLPRP